LDWAKTREDAACNKNASRKTAKHRTSVRMETTSWKPAELLRRPCFRRKRAQQVEAATKA
jgi:hypothetical protein